MDQPITKIENEAGLDSAMTESNINSVDYTYVVSEQHKKMGIHQCVALLMLLLLAKILNYFKRIST